MILLGPILACVLTFGLGWLLCDIRNTQRMRRALQETDEAFGRDLPRPPRRP